ncbi:MAG: methyltransferase domain-containing protein [Verrucomicrobiota bacterium]
MTKPSSSQETYDLSLLDQSLEKWNASTGLQAVYHSIFDDMLRQSEGSDLLELGSGAGFFKQYDSRVTTSDVRKTPFVDLSVSAYEVHSLPQKWDTIFAMDMLHHLTRPFAFFESAAQALKSGGKIILAEPAATLGGRSFYRAFHHEPCNPSELKHPFVFTSDENGEFANMGMSEALFVHHRSEADAALNRFGLKVESQIYRDLAAYPLTGGLSQSQLAPTKLIKALLSIESVLPQSFLRLFALRVIIVIKKHPNP